MRDPTVTDTPANPSATPRPTSIIVADGTNIENRCRECFGRDDIDFNLFFAKVAEGTQLLHVYYFTAPFSPKQNREQAAAQAGRFNALRARANTSLILGRHHPRVVTCKNCTHSYTAFAEKGTDVAAALKLVECAAKKEADQLFLLAGDNDYLPALKMCKSEKVPVAIGFVIGPGPSQPQLNAVSDLRHNSVRYIMLDSAFMESCWRPHRRK
jgi:uncharacterized LabA/DUF88 family protein